MVVLASYYILIIDSLTKKYDDYLVEWPIFEKSFSKSTYIQDAISMGRLSTEHDEISMSRT